MVTRKRRVRAPEVASVSITPALRLLSSTLALVAKPTTPQELAHHHCMIAGGWCVGFDGVLTVGSPIREELTAYPHTGRLLAALERCTEAPTIAQPGPDRLTVTAGRLRGVTVPCVTPDQLAALPSPDPACAPAGEAVRQALAAVSVVAVENAQRTVNACVKVGEGNAEATDGYLLLEAWHGFSMPEALIPKRAIAAVCKYGSPLISFGYSGRSLTFYFQDGAFIKTQLYDERWPRTSILWPQSVNLAPIPDGMFDAVATVQPFTEDDILLFGPEGITTYPPDKQGAFYTLPGLGELAFHANRMLLLKGLVDKVDFHSSDAKVIFFGENLRAILARIKVAI